MASPFFGRLNNSLTHNAAYLADGHPVSLLSKLYLLSASKNHSATFLKGKWLEPHPTIYCFHNRVLLPRFPTFDTVFVIQSRSASCSFANPPLPVSPTAFHFQPPNPSATTPGVPYQAPALRSSAKATPLRSFPRRGLCLPLALRVGLSANLGRGAIAPSSKPQPQISPHVLSV